MSSTAGFFLEHLQKSDGFPMCSRIPQYYAEEATRAIMPLLGDAYHADKKRSFWGCIWESFTQCQYVIPSDPAAKPENRAMYYKGGPSPPIEVSMGRAGLKFD